MSRQAEPEIIRRKQPCPECQRNTVDVYDDGVEQCDGPGCQYSTTVVEPTEPKLLGGESRLVTVADLRDEIIPPSASLRNLGDVMAEIGVETKWIIHRLFAEGDSSLLTAQPGVGKSWFAQQVAVSVAMGRPFLGRDVKQGLVIYFAFEGFQQTARRLRRLGLPDVHANFKMWTEGTDGSSPAAWLEKIIAERRPTLIVLDCLQHVAQSKEGNSYSEAYKLLGPVTQLAARMKMHVLALHHSSAKEERGGVGAALGSTGIPAAFGTAIHLRRLDQNNEDGSSPRVFSCSNKHRLGLMGPADIPTVILVANPFTARLEVAGSLVDVAAQMIGTRIIEAVEAASEPLSRVEVVKAGMARTQNVERVIARLLKLGIIVREGSGFKTSKHRFVLGPTSAGQWLADFKDAGTTAFDPPPVPVEEAQPMAEVAPDF